MSDHSKMNKDEQFLLKIVQPSLLGFMDGSISTLAPVFGFAVSGDAKTAFMAGTLVSRTPQQFRGCFKIPYRIAL